jgi:hypothetical protein
MPSLDDSVLTTARRLCQECYIPIEGGLKTALDAAHRAGISAIPAAEERLSREPGLGAAAWIFCAART